MNRSRRAVLQQGGLLGVMLGLGLLSPAMAALPATRKAFEARTLDAAFAALGTAGPLPSTAILIDAPELADNGNSVTIGVRSQLPDTEQIAILVERNPNLLAAHFLFPPGTRPALQTRIKMQQSSFIHVLVKAQGQFHVARKEVRVTLSGCNG